MVDLKKNIKSHGWTISALAERLGTTQSSVSTSFITGATSLTRLQEIADIIGIPLSELVTDDRGDATAACPHCGKPIKVHLS